MDSDISHIYFIKNFCERYTCVRSPIQSIRCTGIYNVRINRIEFQHLNSEKIREAFVIDLSPGVTSVSTFNNTYSVSTAGFPYVESYIGGINPVHFSRTSINGRRICRMDEYGRYTQDR